MKNKKLLFNHLVLQYHKSVGRLKRLSERGLNFRRQTILSKRIEKIKQQLLSIKYALTKVAAIAGLTAAVVVLQPKNAQAQNFQPPVVNPFLLNTTSESISNIKSVDYADLDLDGDFDAIIYNRILNRFYYLQNIGTPEIPEYSIPNELSIAVPPIQCEGEYYNGMYYECFYPQILDNICFGDLDADGDFDLMAGGLNGNFIYFENIGTDSLPEYGEGVTNPFSLTDLYNYEIDQEDYICFLGENTIEFVDLDGDGDLDIYTISEFYDFETYGGWGDYDGPFGVFGAFNRYYYFENIGSPTSPIFDIKALSNFGFSGLGDFADLDMDGDFDYLTGMYQMFYDGGFYGNYISYKENTGSNILPEFINTSTNPFGLETIINEFLFSPALIDFDHDNDLDLMFLKTPNDFYYYENKTCDTTTTDIITVNGGVLTAEVPDAQYQWYNCNTFFSIDFPYPIEGATSQNYSPVYSNYSENYYSVQINTENCVFTSDCFEFLSCYLSNSISINETTITGSSNATSYQWLDCNNGYFPIDGAFSNSYTPIISGSYALTMNILYCTDTSSCYDFTICEDLSANIIIDGNSLVAEQAGGVYQWINCNNYDLLEGETNQTFTPESSGSYYTFISLNNCYYHTDCVSITATGINDHSPSNQFSIVPNPTEGKLNVTADKPLQNAFVQIKSITGQIIFEQKNISGANLVFDLSNHANGLYFLEVTENGVTTRLKIIKE